MNTTKAALILAILAIVGWIAYDWTNTPEKSVTVKTGVKSDVKKKPPIFKWTDENGTVHFTDDEDGIPEKYRPNAKDVELDNMTVLDAESARNLVKSGQKDFVKPTKNFVERSKRITLYGASWCPNTQRTRRLLDEMKVGYAYLDVEKDVRSMQALLNFSGGKPVVPALLVEGRVILGYRPGEIRAALQHTPDRE